MQGKKGLFCKKWCFLLRVFWRSLFPFRIPSREGKGWDRKDVVTVPEPAIPRCENSPCSSPMPWRTAMHGNCDT